MKRLVVCLICLLAVIRVDGAGFSVSVGSTSTTLAPVRNSATAVQWASGKSYKQGQVVKYGGVYFMLETAVASSSTTPDADVATYRKLYSNTARDSVVLRNMSDSTVWISIGEAAVVGKGFYLKKDEALSIVDVQDSVHAISEGSSVVVGNDNVK